MDRDTGSRVVPRGAFLAHPADPLTALSRLAQADDAAAVLAAGVQALGGTTGARQVVAVTRGALAHELPGVACLAPGSTPDDAPLERWLDRSELITSTIGVRGLHTPDELMASPAWRLYLDQPAPHLPTVGWLSVPILDADGETLAILTASMPANEAFRVADLHLASAIAAACGQALERVRLTRILGEALTQRQAFFGVLSHELRTPITTIYGGSRVLQQSGPRLSHDAQSQLLDDIAADAERLFRLVEDLLVLSRAEGGALEVTLEPVHLGRVIARVTASEQARWPRTHMVTKIDPALPPVEAEETFVEQVLRNLLSNAAKYAGHAGPIVVEADRDGAWVRVAVTDQGVGLSPEDLGQIFGLFYRATSTAASAPGAGIGLYACRQLVQAMGGELEASRRPEGGTQFTIRLRPMDVDG